MKGDFLSGFGFGTVLGAAFGITFETSMMVYLWRKFGDFVKKYIIGEEMTKRGKGTCPCC